MLKWTEFNFQLFQDKQRSIFVILFEPQKADFPAKSITIN